MTFQSLSSSKFRTVFGIWRKAPPAERDLEAQTEVVGPREYYLDIDISTPPAARTHTPHAQPSYSTEDEEGTDPVDDFFGVVRSSHPSRSCTGTQDSRHDAARIIVQNDDVPPPYTYASDPPAYSRVAEHPTLAMYLFRFGFCKSAWSRCPRKPLLIKLLPSSIPTFLDRWLADPDFSTSCTRGLGAL